MNRLISGTVVTLLALSLVGDASAQGVQTGSVRGVVKDATGQVVPQTAIRAESSAQQGARMTASDQAGAYQVAGLAPGDYTLRFEFAGFQTVTSTVRVGLGSIERLDVTLRPTVTESVTVTAPAPSLLTRRGGGSNIRTAEIEMLPTGRTPSLVAELSPGLTNNTPNVNQVTISGGLAYDNVFLLDGVDIGDNLFARPDDLFVEEAIQETQVLTSAVSAEYGRFSGGVVNAITKRGGNTFSGSVRSNLTNAAWTNETPFEKAAGQHRQNKMDRYYEGTFGGPLREDRAWFFFSGRSQSSNTSLTLAQTAAAFQQTDDQHRWDLKVTAKPMTNQTVQVQYLDRRQSKYAPSLPITIDPTGGDHTDTPGNLFVGNWDGVMANRFFATAQYSRKTNHPRFGNTSTRLQDSPFLTIGRVSPGGLQFGPIYFDRTDPEDRDNNQLTGSVSYFGSRPGLGTHDVKAGAEVFSLVLRGGNSQSSTGYLFNTDYASVAGRPVTDSTGRVVPVWIPGFTSVGNTLPTRGAELDITTTSLYVQDRWTLSRLTLDLGLRYEHVASEATGGADSIGAQTVVPRLAASYQLREDGRTVVGGSYAHYAGRYSSSIFGRNTPVANSGRVTSIYNGPAGQGYDFAPAYDLSNYTVTSGSFPTANIFLDDNLHSPLTREFTVSAAQQVGNGALRSTYVWRKATGLVESFIDDPLASGKTTVAQNGTTFGVFDNVYYRNSDQVVRDYQALETMGNYRVRSNWSVAGHWTMQLKNEGNYEGEAANQPGVGTLLGDYPELYIAARNFPAGRLDDYQQHKVRVWSTYQLSAGRLGSFDITPMWRYNSALTYSLVANSVPLSAVQRARNPGYARVPTSQSLFFGERGSQEFKGYGLVDLAVTYQVPVWKSLKPWLKLEVLNALDNNKLIAWDTTITANPASELDEDALPTGYVQGPRFGQGTSTASYPRPRPGLTGGRTFLGAFGFRF
ncbi:MAG TPA: TonB-dependent receptor [Vicinamibacterales bacterium]|nr:TonB-dependent receptor [Vicinamibacterales bacterium]